MLHNRENVQDVLLCEGRLMAAVKVVLLNQDLQGELKVEETLQRQCHKEGLKDFVK